MTQAILQEHTGTKASRSSRAARQQDCCKVIAMGGSAVHRYKREEEIRYMASLAFIREES